MAAGLPVIVSPDMEAKGAVEDGINGSAAPDPRNGGLVAGAMIALSDPEFRARMGAEAQRTAEQSTWDRARAEVARLYQEMIDRRPAARG
jgi:glycosyltransferase involved in cell wall biosynthesis